MVLAPTNIRDQLIVNGTFIELNCIRFTNCAKNLGVWLDQQLNFQIQVSKKVSSSYETLRNIGKIKYYLTSELLTQVMTALIFSNLDYCNVIYFGIGKREIDKLQSVQNAAVRVIFGKINMIGRVCCTC